MLALLFHGRRNRISTLLFDVLDDLLGRTCHKQADEQTNAEGEGQRGLGYYVHGYSKLRLNTAVPADHFPYLEGMKTLHSLHIVIAIVSCLVMAFSCSPEERVPSDDSQNSRSAESPAPSSILRASFAVTAAYPHDRNAFTQGLVVHGTTFLESTGQNGGSSLRIVDIKTGRVRKRTDLDARYFGEGMTVIGSKAFMLTWMNQKGFIFDIKTLQQIGEFTYAGEGWGLTTDGTKLYMSNGTSTIAVLDPTTFRVERLFNVTVDGIALDRLNELEWINGEIWANIWMQDVIVAINPQSGKVSKIVDLTGLLPQSERRPDTDVLNGIAWDSVGRKLYVTGKNWPWVYSITTQPDVFTK